MTRLWHDAATAAFTDPSLCVEGSRGFSAADSSPKAPPKPISQEPILSLNSTSTQQAGVFEEVPDGLENARSRIRVSTPTQLCPANKSCPFGYACRSVTVTCAAEGTRTVPACIPACQNGGQCVGTCKLTSNAESKRQTFRAQDGTTQYQEKLSTGFCYPRQGTRALGCKYDPGTI
jgi:hypothetical protein